MDITSFELYKLTLPIVGTENLVMGLSLLTLYISRRYHIYPYKLGVFLLSIAMLIMAVVNYAEMFDPSPVEKSSSSFVIFSITASFQLFLFLYTFMVLIDRKFVTFRRTCVELFLILIFTSPPLLVNEQDHPQLFHTLFYISIGFYCVKLIANLWTYKKHFREAQAKLQDSYSEGSANLLNWINHTFYTVMAIGLTSIFIPLSNHIILAIHNTFLFIAYFYIYNQVLLHISIFKDIDRFIIDNEASAVTTSPRVSERFMDERKMMYAEWLARRLYTKTGITIEDVAIQLGTNRTSLSAYLNTELKQNFYEWISSLRIENAKQQLINQPATPIIDIANDVGIEDRSNFDKTFKHITGISPAAYRKQYYTQK